jgi:hypothetical protein
MKLRTYEKVILTGEVVGIFAVLTIIWLDEFVDIPALFFGALKTPPRPEEYWFESLAVFFLGVLVASTTFWIFRRLRYLVRFVASARGDENYLSTSNGCLSRST